MWSSEDLSAVDKGVLVLGYVVPCTEDVDIVMLESDRVNKVSEASWEDRVEVDELVLDLGGLVGRGLG